jgi:hypothetical protein
LITSSSTKPEKAALRGLFFQLVREQATERREGFRERDEAAIADGCALPRFHVAPRTKSVSKSQAAGKMPSGAVQGARA